MGKCECGHSKNLHEKSIDTHNHNRGSCGGIGGGMFNHCYCMSFRKVKK